MKKIILCIICLELLNLPAIAAFYEDELAKNLRQDLALQKVVIPKYEDELIKNLVYVSRNNAQIPKYEDELINALPDNLKIENANKVIYFDKFAEDNLKNINFIDYSAYLKYDYSIDKKYVYVQSLKHVTTKNKPKEGEYLHFALTEDITVNNKKIPKGTIVKGRIETLTDNAPFGSAAQIEIGNFKIEGYSSINLRGAISKSGANRAIWVVPLGYAGCMFFYAGLPLFFIRGGHAKISPNEKFELYYL